MALTVRSDAGGTFGAVQFNAEDILRIDGVKTYAAPGKAIVANVGAVTASGSYSINNSSGSPIVTVTDTNRLQADFSNSSQSQRLLFQSNVANGSTNVGAIPNGTNRRSQFSCFGNVDPANASILTMIADETAGGCFLSAFASGAGAFLPLVFQAGGAERFRLSATENRFQALFNGSDSGLNFQTSIANDVTNVGVMPNGTSKIAYISVFGASSMANASAALFGLDAGGGNSRVFIEATKNGSGTYLPLTFATGGAERARFFTDGQFSVGGISANGGRINSVYTRATLHGLVIRPDADSGPGSTVFFMNASSAAVGSINTTAASTAYNTSSDYRLKENIQQLVAPLQRLLRLNPVTFDWKADGSEGEGFIAHELQIEVPLAVTGEKDGEAMQGVDYGKVVPLLVAAVQELAKEVAALKTQLGGGGA